MAIKPTVSWDETKPGGGRDISLGDNDIKEFKTQVREVLAADHEISSSGQGALWGHHNIVTLLVQTSITALANAGKLYAKDVSAKAELHYKDEDGNEIQITTGGAINLSSGKFASQAQGDVFYASSGTAIARLAKDTNATRYLSNTGTNNNAKWAQINLANGVTGALPMANGGTSLSTIAKGEILHASAANTLAALAVGNAGKVLRANGAGNAVSWGSNMKIGTYTGNGNAGRAVTHGAGFSPSAIIVTSPGATRDIGIWLSPGDAMIFGSTSNSNAIAVTSTTFTFTDAALYNVSGRVYYYLCMFAD